MSFTPNDIEKIRLLFEDGLKRAKGVDRVDKIKIRAKIRREISSISSLKNPTTDMVLGRWKYKLSEVFSLFPQQFGNDLKNHLQKILKKK
jgi:hypothetical protein